jgi:hypothetical protein
MFHKHAVSNGGGPSKEGALQLRSAQLSQVDVLITIHHCYLCPFTEGALQLFGPRLSQMDVLITSLSLLVCLFK